MTGQPKFSTWPRSAAEMPSSAVSPPLTWPQITAPRPPVGWVCPALRIAPGRPALLSAPPGVGKTNVAMSMSLAVASGGSAPACLSTVPITRFGRAVYLNFDSSAAWTCSRLARLGFGLDFAPRGIVPDVHLYNIEQLRGFQLASPGAYDALCRIAEGSILCTVDALRGALAGVDLNDGRVREHLDVFTHASESTGCAFLLVHHDKKPSDSSTSDLRQHRAGGSHQIVAAVDVTIHIEPTPDGAWRIVLGKVSNGNAQADDITVRLTDIGDLGPDGVSQGMRFEAATETRSANESGTSNRQRELELRILELVSARSGEFAGVEPVRAEIGGDSVAVRRAWKTLEGHGLIENRGGKGRAARWHASPDLANQTEAEVQDVDGR